MYSRSAKIFTLIFLCGAVASAQQATGISGWVTDESGEPVIGANIFIPGSYDGATSMEEGRFSFSTDLTGGQVLRVSYLGYEEFEKSLQLEGQHIELEIILSPGAVELKDVVITAGAFEAGGERRREVLNPLDIVTTAGATADLAGVFNTLPGTQVVGEEGRLFVRGGEGYETKTFIDGMQVAGFYSPSAPNTPSRSRFLPFMFSGASFSTGGYSAEYGQALSSALILRSRPVATQSRMDISLMSVGADVGFTQAWGSASLSGKAQYTNLDPYFSLISQEGDWIDPPTSYEGSFAYRKNLNDSGILKIYGVGNFSAFQLNQYDIDRPDVPVSTDLRNSYGYLNAVLQQELENEWFLRTGFSLTNDHDRIFLDRDEVVQNELDVHVKATLEKELTSRIGIKFGSEFLLTDAHQEFREMESGEKRSMVFTTPLPAAFIESDIRLSKRLLARAGLRSVYSAGSGELFLAPRLSLAFKTGAHSQLSAAFGRFHQAADSPYRLLRSDLGQEKAAHFLLNYQVMQDGRTFRAEVYYKKYEDLVKFDAPDSGPAGALTNAGTGYARGFDLFWRDSRSIKGGDYWLSYSFLDTRRDYRDFPEPATPSFASRHNFSAVYKHFISPLKSQVGFTFRYTSGRPYHDPNFPGFQNRWTKEYYDLSFNLSYLVRQNLIIHLSATNVLGRENIFGYEFASQPDDDGFYRSRAIRPPADRFLFVGAFLTIAKDPVLNQLPNL